VSAATESTLPQGIRPVRSADPCTVIIFGASGDLTKRKLVPALYRLVRQRLVPAEFAIVGQARTANTDDAFRDSMKQSVVQFSDEKMVDDEAWRSFAQGLYYLSSDIGNADDYRKLSELLDRIDRERGTAGNRLFYLSVAPRFFAEAVEQLGRAGLTKPKPGSWVRVIIEKPFGSDLDSARLLNRQIRRSLNESQIYRIDHYLGKETVQNLLALRFANGIYEPLWNRQYIDHVQITNAEAVGVEGRGGYYETAGVLRDMIQNHVFQVLSLVAMEPPASLGAEEVRDEKIKVMTAARAFTPQRVDAECVRGQYGAGSIAGKPVPGYREEHGVAPDSTTETYALLTMYFDNWRWAGVPFYIRSAKRMPKRVTEIAIVFRAAPHQLFGNKVMELVNSIVFSKILEASPGLTG